MELLGVKTNAELVQQAIKKSAISTRLMPVRWHASILPAYDLGNGRTAVPIPRSEGLYCAIA